MAERLRTGAVFRRAGFHRLPGLGARALRPRRDHRLRLRPAPRRRAGAAPRDPRRDRGRISALGRPPRRRPPARARRRSGQISDTALTRDAAFEMTAAGLPNTFVPGRNLLFFTYAAALGLSARHPHARRRHVRDRLLRLPRLPQRHAADARQGHLARHGRALHHRDAADVDRQGRHLGDGRAARRRRRWSTSSSSTRTPATRRTARHGTPGAYGCGHCPACESARERMGAMADRQDMTRAVDLAIAGDWEAAHKIAQQDEDDPPRAGSTPCCTRSRAMPATPATGTASPANPTKPSPTPRPNSPPSRPCYPIDGKS